MGHHASVPKGCGYNIGTEDNYSFVIVPIMWLQINVNDPSECRYDLTPTDSQNLIKWIEHISKYPFDDDKMLKEYLIDIDNRLSMNQHLTLLTEFRHPQIEAVLKQYRNNPLDLKAMIRTIEHCDEKIDEHTYNKFLLLF